MIPLLCTLHILIPDTHLPHGRQRGWAQTQLHLPAAFVPQSPHMPKTDRCQRLLGLECCKQVAAWR